MYRFFGTQTLLVFSFLTVVSNASDLIEGEKSVTRYTIEKIMAIGEHGLKQELTTKIKTHLDNINAEIDASHAEVDKRRNQNRVNRGRKNVRSDTKTKPRPAHSSGSEEAATKVEGGSTKRESPRQRSDGGNPWKGPSDIVMPTSSPWAAGNPLVQENAVSSNQGTSLDLSALGNRHGHKSGSAKSPRETDGGVKEKRGRTKRGGKKRGGRGRNEQLKNKTGDGPEKTKSVPVEKPAETSPVNKVSSQLPVVGNQPLVNAKGKLSAPPFFPKIQLVVTSPIDDDSDDGLERDGNVTIIEPDTIVVWQNPEYKI